MLTSSLTGVICVASKSTVTTTSPTRNAATRSSYMLALANGGNDALLVG